MKLLFITKDSKATSGWGRLGSETKNGYERKGLEVDYLLFNDNENFLRMIFNCWKSYWIGNKTGSGYDVVHAMDLWPYGLYAFFASGMGRKKYLVNGIGTYTISPLTKTGVKKIWSVLCKLILRNAAGVPCISEYTKSEIDKHTSIYPPATQGGKTKTKVVLMGLSKMSEVKPNLDILKKYGVDETSFPVLCTVGEIKHRKGQLQTAQAVAKLKEKYPNIKYLIVGRPYDNYIKQIKEVDASVGGNIIHIVTDAKGDEELRTIYERSDVFALNSNNDQGHFEGFGLVVLEANQFGVPAVGSKNCGIESAIKDGENGYLCEMGNAEDIKNKIEMILEKKKENPNYWKQKCIDWANTFSWDKSVSGYLALLK